MKEQDYTPLLILGIFLLLIFIIVAYQSIYIGIPNYQQNIKIG